jgi:protein ImuA
LRQIVDRGSLVLIGAPHLPNLAALVSAGLRAEQILRIDAPTPAQRLWAAEQVLRCQELGALLAWLPQARSEQLRRLQLASTSTQALVFAFRPEQARHESSPAPLRLGLRVAPEDNALSVELLKRRGPHIDHPVTLTASLVQLHFPMFQGS